MKIILQRTNFSLKSFAMWVEAVLVVAIVFFSVSAHALQTGDRVQANATVNVRSSAAGTILGTQASGNQGNIIGGPQIASLSGTSYTWWNVNWDSGVDGWVADIGLTLITTIPATPTNTSPGSTTSPGPTTSSSTVTLSWSASNGATSYGLGVRDIASNTLVVDTYVTSTSYSANLTAGKQYRWNVDACNTAGCSSYSTVLYFQTPGATVTIPATPTNTSPGSTTSPGPTTSSSTVNLSWSASSGATSYGLGVRDIASNILVVDTYVTGTSYSANLTAGKQYRWNVNACNTAGCSSYSTVLYFQTPTPSTTPTLSTISPNTITQGTSYQNVTFTGSNFTASSWHQFSINAGSSWTWATSAPTFVNSTTMTVAVNNTVAQTIYWRICASNGSTACSGSQTVTVQTATTTDTTKPTVSAFNVAPGSLTIGSSFTISYTVSDAGGSGLWQAQLWRTTDSGGQPNASNWTKITTNSISGNGPESGSFTDAPSSAGTYWYGMHGVDTALNIGYEPSAVKVMVNSASTTNGICGTSNNGSFTTAPTANLCSSGTATVVSGSGPWTWSCNGLNGGNSASCSATIQSIPGLLPAPILAGPTGSAISTTPTFSWSTVTGANRYWLMVAADPSAFPAATTATSCSSCIISGNTDALSYTLPGLFPQSTGGGIRGNLNPGTTYYWRVQAWNNNGTTATGDDTQGIYSGSASFTTAGLPPVKVGRFDFDAIASQIPATPFRIRIQAVDANGNPVTSFSGSVQLTADGGNQPSSSRLTITNGVFDGNISLLQSGLTRFRAYATNSDGSSIEGLSNYFSVTTPASQTTFTVLGTARPGTSVHLESGSTTIYPASDVVADSAGKFRIDAVPLGNWKVVGTLSGRTQICTYFDCYHRVDKNITVSINMVTSDRPVIFIPGVMGSTLSEQGISNYGVDQPRNFADHIVGQAPKLPRDKCTTATDCELRKYLQVYDPVVQYDTAMGSNYLYNALTDAGFLVFPTPWDWRMSFKDAAEIYLKPKIDEVKRVTGYNKVDIVAHSMGGLVARSYIQGDSYGNDVDRLIMLGTPNNGSTNAYYLMEGGDPLLLDNTVNNLLASGLADVAFYTAAVNELWRTYVGDDLLGGLSFDGDVQNDSKYKRGITTRDIKNFLNARVPGGRDLLPVYDFMQNTYSSAYGFPDTNSELNLNLRNLNADTAGLSLFTSIGSISEDKVKVKLFLSNSESTLNLLGYTNKGTDTFNQGIPNFTGYRESGDGTVLAEEGKGPFDSGVVEKDDFGTHPEMVGNANARDKVVSALTNGRIMKSVALKAAPTRATAIPLLPLADVSIGGSYSPLLTASDGKHTGTSFGTSDVFEEIPDSSVSLTPYQNRIGLSSPVSGIYRLTVSAEGTLTNTAARLSLNFFNPDAGTQEDSARLLVKTSPYQLDVSLDPNATRWFRLVDLVLPPTGLDAMLQDGNTLLRWTAAADASATGYHIYMRPGESNVFQYLGQTAGNELELMTSIPWASDYAGSSEFVVVSVNAATVESLIRGGNSVRNVSYAHAAFTAGNVDANGKLTSSTYPLPVTFTDKSEATGTIQRWEWDFNNDGIIDSTVQHPTFTYTQPGIYAVSLRVTSSDALMDTKTVTDFVTINGMGPVGNVDTTGPSANRIDGYDLITLSIAFGSQPGAANWNSSCDLDNTGASNNYIDGNDLIVLGTHFGEVQ